MKDAANSQMQRFLGGGPEGPELRGFILPASGCVPPPRHSGTFVDASSQRHGLCQHSAQPLALPQRAGVEPNVPSFESKLGLSGDLPEAIQEPAKSRLIGAKDTAITQQIPRGFRAACHNEYIHIYSL